MIHFLEFVGIIIAVVVVWNKLHSQQTQSSEVVTPSPDRSSADDA